jgi:hypothetical protein
MRIAALPELLPQASAFVGSCRSRRAHPMTALSQLKPFDRYKLTAEVGKPERARQCRLLGHSVDLAACTLLFDTERSAGEN